MRSANPKTIGLSLATALVLSLAVLPWPTPAAEAMPLGGDGTDGGGVAPDESVGPCDGVGLPVKEVTIRNFEFDPADITTGVNTMVRWTNDGPSAHTTTSDDGWWDSGSLPVGGDYVVLFCMEGEFPYHCDIHTFMQGIVRVQ